MTFGNSSSSSLTEQGRRTMKKLSKHLRTLGCQYIQLEKLKKYHIDNKLKTILNCFLIYPSGVTLQHANIKGSMLQTKFLNTLLQFIAWAWLMYEWPKVYWLNLSTSLINSGFKS